MLVLTEYCGTYMYAFERRRTGRSSPVGPVPIGRAPGRAHTRLATKRALANAIDRWYGGRRRNECWLIVIALPLDSISSYEIITSYRRRLRRRAFPPQCVGGNYCSPAAGRRGIWLTTAGCAHAEGRVTSRPTRTIGEGMVFDAENSLLPNGVQREGARGRGRLWRREAGTRAKANRKHYAESICLTIFLRSPDESESCSTGGREWETPEEHCVCRSSFNFEGNKTFRKDPRKSDP